MLKKTITLLFILILSGSLIAQDLAIDSGQLSDPVFDGTNALLFDNFINPGTTGIVSGLWGALPAGSNQVLCADDFVVPAGETWTIDEIAATGFHSVGFADVWGIDFYTNAAGSPGTLITSETVAVVAGVEDPAGPLSNPVVLAEGTYWISIYGISNTGTALTDFRWNWYASADNTPGVGLEPRLNDMALFFGGTGGWATFTSLGLPQFQNLMFQLYGTVGGSGGAEFFDDFEAYTSGIQLCVQTTEWEPWVGSAPGSAADPFVSSAYSYSGANSVVIVSNNDVVRRHGPKTSGTWYISFVFYIPSGNSGYFNTMNDYDPNVNVWGMDSYFDAGGTGRLDTTGGGGGTFVVPFNWTQDAWNQVVVVVDLDATPPMAEYWIGTSPANFTQIATWGWTQNGTKPAQLAVNDLFGAAGTDQMYVDDFYFGDAMPPIIPVELTSFTAISNNGIVELNWETATEVNNHMFEIERKSDVSGFITIGYVEGHGTTTEPQSYRYADNNVEVGTYTYRLKQIDFDGTYAYSDAVEVDVTAPLAFNLAQNYPNPFNPSTNIKYSVPEAGNVKLSVYNLVGEEVAVLVNGYTDAGQFNVSFDASNLPSGVYLYKLQSANLVQTKKMMLLK